MRRPVSYADQAGPIGPLGWILHVVVGNGSPWSTFEHAVSPHRRFSHLWVAKDGTAEQYAPLSRQSWAQSAGNNDYWSVETEGFPEEPLTDAQIQTLGQWHAWSTTPDRLANNPGQVGIGTHYMGGAAWGGHSCPDPVGKEGKGPRSLQRQAVIDSGGNMPLTAAEIQNIADMSALEVMRHVRGQYQDETGGLHPNPPKGTFADKVDRTAARVTDIDAKVDALLARPPVDVPALAAAIVALLPAQVGLTVADVEQAVTTVLHRT